MEKKEFQNLMKDMKIVKNLLTASLYAQGISSEDLSKITGIHPGNIRKLISKRKIRS